AEPAGAPAAPAAVAASGHRPCPNRRSRRRPPAPRGERARSAACGSGDRAPIRDSKRKLALRQASVAMTLTSATALASQLRRAVSDQRVLAAVASIPRERFVPEELRARAYENVALPIGGGQTISQPVVAAGMLGGPELGRADGVPAVGPGPGTHPAWWPV